MTDTARPSRSSKPRPVVDATHPAGIKAFGPNGLERLVLELGEPKYRARQIMRWLYARGVSSWDEMTDVPAALRASLAEKLPLTTLDLVVRQESRIDDTRKYLWGLADGVAIESVGLPTPDRLTVCFSTQAGCAMGCSFCATGQGGLARNLAPGEMVDQVRLVGADFERRVTNAVAMGQGEPFANYNATLAALRILNSADGLGIGARHMTISTCGLTAGIRRLAEEPEQFTLAVSLHSAVQGTRDRLMPGVAHIPLGELRASISDYTSATGRRVTFEYALIEDINDTDAEVAALARFCAGLLCHVNLIPANPVVDTSFGRSRDAVVQRFARTLSQGGVEVTIRAERGTDIDAACGQLRQRTHETGSI